MTMSTGTGLTDTEDDIRTGALESPTVIPMEMSGRVLVTNKMKTSLLLKLKDGAGTFFVALSS